MQFLVMGIELYNYNVLCPGRSCSCIDVILCLNKCQYCGGGDLDTGLDCINT